MYGCHNEIENMCTLGDLKYTLRIVKGERGSDDICVGCELEKCINKDDFEIREVLYVRNTMRVCGYKMEELGDLLAKRSTKEIREKFHFAKLCTDFNTITEELKVAGLWSLHTEDGE